MENIYFLVGKLMMSPRREGNQKTFQSALAGDCFFSSGKIPGGMNSAVAGMMTGAGMPGPDHISVGWFGPGSPAPALPFTQFPGHHTGIELAFLPLPEKKKKD